MAKSKKNFVEKRSKYLIIAAVAIIAVIGVSYAWFTQVLTGTKKATLTAGNLELKLDETASEGIEINPAIPMTDEDGKATDPYKFTLENIGDIESVYTISLVNDPEYTGTLIPEDKIKYNLTTDGVAGDAKLLGNKVLATGSLKPNGEDGSKIDYELRMWIDSSATTAISGQGYAAKIKIEASQTGIPEGTNVDYSTGQTIPPAGE